MSPGRPRRLWGEGLRLVTLSRLDGRRMRPWNLARLGLRLRCRFILPGLGLRDLGASRTSVLSSSSSELVPELSVGLLPSSDLGREICTPASALLADPHRGLWGTTAARLLQPSTPTPIPPASLSPPPLGRADLEGLSHASNAAGGVAVVSEDVLPLPLGQGLLQEHHL